jgi:hypothetical protein
LRERGVAAWGLVAADERSGEVAVAAHLLFRDLYHIAGIDEPQSLAPSPANLDSTEVSPELVRLGYNPFLCLCWTFMYYVSSIGKLYL